MQRTLEPGEILYHQGDPNTCAFLISEGEVSLLRNKNGKTRIVERRGAGSLVGETSVLMDKSRTVTVRAESRCRVFAIPADRILTKFESLDPILRACIETTINFVEALHGRDDAPETATTCPPDEVTHLIERLKLEEDLTRGLDRGEFFVVYQPIIDLSGGGVAGFEALTRWTHPELGPVRPDHFIAVAEDMGAIGKITEIALTDACQTLRRCREEIGKRMFASVNISARDLGRPDFVEFLTHVLDQNGLLPDDIKLELTESALLPSTAIAETNLERLRAQQFGISVDDFGTGYSNLGYLQLLPIKTLKIDRSFASGAHASSVARGIVRMLIALGKELNVDVVAEGVEEQADVTTLEDLGCRFVQGYFFHKPMVKDALLDLLRGAQFAVA